MDSDQWTVVSGPALGGRLRRAVRVPGYWVWRVKLRAGMRIPVIQFHCAPNGNNYMQTGGTLELEWLESYRDGSGSTGLDKPLMRLASDHEPAPVSSGSNAGVGDHTIRNSLNPELTEHTFGSPLVS